MIRIPARAWPDRTGTRYGGLRIGWYDGFFGGYGCVYFGTRFTYQENGRIHCLGGWVLSSAKRQSGGLPAGVTVGEGGGNGRDERRE